MTVVHVGNQRGKNVSDGPFYTPVNHLSPCWCRAVLTPVGSTTHLLLLMLLLIHMNVQFLTTRALYKMYSICRVKCMFNTNTHTHTHTHTHISLGKKNNTVHIWESLQKTDRSAYYEPLETIWSHYEHSALQMGIIVWNVLVSYRPVQLSDVSREEKEASGREQGRARGQRERVKSCVTVVDSFPAGLLPRRSIWDKSPAQVVTQRDGL